MADLQFTTTLTWEQTGRQGHGTVMLGEKAVDYSAPYSMGGKGEGTSPEELLMAAVAACYSGTLFSLLSREELPAARVNISVEGIVTDYPLNGKFATLRVNPEIVGGDPEQLSVYQTAAQKARDRCFIGKTIQGNVKYEVGEVRIS